MWSNNRLLKNATFPEKSYLLTVYDWRPSSPIPFFSS